MTDLIPPLPQDIGEFIAHSYRVRTDKPHIFFSEGMFQVNRRPRNPSKLQDIHWRHAAKMVRRMNIERGLI